MNDLRKTDSQIYNLIKQEEKRIGDTLELIPSNNFQSKAVLEALGSIYNYKYSEGYPKKRYYQGQEFADDVEILAQDRAKKLFGVPYVNVQPYSGSPANTAVYFALLEPFKDKIMGLSLAFGGHLTHGSPVSFSGKYFTIAPYELDKNGYLNYDAIEKLALIEKPKIIVCGATAYPRIIDFKRFGEIADKVGAYLLADISHITGLIIAGVHPSPIPYVHIVMTTTHKTLRGPRGAMIMVTKKGLEKDPDLGKRLEKSVMPGLQGGPHDHQTAAIAVSLEEALKPSFKTYIGQVVKNAKVLGEELGIPTEVHLLLMSLASFGYGLGYQAQYALEEAGITVNKNTIPGEPASPFYPSGIRLGTPALTTRGMKEKEMKKIAAWIKEALEEIRGHDTPNEKELRAQYIKDFKKKIVGNKNLLRIKKFLFPT